MTDVNVSLGGREFTIRPFTFAQLKAIMPAFARSGGKLITAGAFDAARDILVAAFSSPENPVTAEEIEALPLTAPELYEALDRIAEVSGLAPAGEPEQASSTGTTSTPT